MAAYYPPLENLPTFDVKVFRDAQDVVDYSTTTSNIALTSDNSSGTYYIPFSKTTSTVSNALYIDNVTTPLTYDPATGTLSATNFSGSFPAPTTILVTDNNTATTYYPVFAATGTGQRSLFSDFTTTPLSYVPSTSTLTATTFSGSLSGTATNATNVNLTVDNTANTYYLTFASSGAGNKALLYDTTSTPLSYIPSTSTLSATNFSGLASNATQVNITSNNTAGTFYLVFASSIGTGQNALQYDDATNPLSYVPSTSTLSCSTVTASLNGNALTATTASTSNNIALTSDNTAGTYYIPFSKTTSATSNALFIDDVTTPLTYNPSTSTLTATNFSGNASTSTTATTSNNIALTSDNTAGTYYIPFSKTTSATSNTLFIDDVTTPLTYNPNSSTLTCTTVSANLNGNATTASTASTSNNIALTSDNTAGTYFIPFSKTTSATSNALFIDNVTTPLTYDPSTSTLTASIFNGVVSTSSTSNNVALTSDNTAGTYYIPFSKTTSATSNALFIDDVTTPLTYDPSTSTLTASIFNGTVSTATTATTSNNIALTSDNTAGTYYIPFSKTTSATSNTLFIDDVTTPLTYNPSTSTLTATNFNGTVTNSTNATNATNVNLTDNSSSSTVHYLTYATTGGGNKPLYYSYVSNQLTFQPNIGLLSCYDFNSINNATFNTIDTVFLQSSTSTLDIKTIGLTFSVQLSPDSTLVLDVKKNGIDAYQSIDMKTNDITNATNITATTFNGDLNGNSSSTSNIALTSDNTVGTYYIPFSKTTSATSNALYIDDVTSPATPLTYNPNSSTLTCTTVSANLNGNATTSTTASTSNNIALTSDNTAGTYFIPFSKTTSATSNALFIDNVTTPLTYDPSTSTLTASIFNGTVSTASTSNNIALTSDNTAGTYYIPFSKTTSATSNALFIDDVTTPLTYDPSTSTLTATNFSGLASSSTTVAVAGNNTATTMYPIFTTNGAGQKSLLFDNATGPLSYVPSTGSFNALQYTINGTSLVAGSNNTSLSQSSTILSLTNYSTSSSIQFNTYSSTNILTNSATVTSTLFQTTVPIATDDSASGDRLALQAITTGASWNPITVANGSLIYAKSSAVNTQSLSITIWSNTTNGIVLTPLYTLIGFGGTAAVPTTNITFTGTNTTLSGPAININNNNFNFGSVTTCSAGYGAGDATNLIISNSGVASTVFTIGRNTIIGQESGTTLVVGSAENTLIGWRAGPDCANSYQNTFVGSQTGFQSGSAGVGENNTCVGYAAGFGLSGSGRGNTLIGAGVASSISTGQNNSCYGINSGDNITTGSNNICIGVNATVPTATASNQIAIGTSSDTMYIRGGFNWRVGTQITANITLTAPLAQFYTVAMAAATQTITLPAPNNTTLLGQTIIFKRKTNTTAFTLAAGAGTPFIPIASITAAATIAVGTTVFQVMLVCDGTHWCNISQA